MMQTSDSFYVTGIQPQEQRGFNVLFPYLVSNKDVDQRMARKILSGVRLLMGTNAKVGKSKATIWLRHWHDYGLVSLIHGRVRLGSIGIYSSVLEERNKVLIRKSVR